MSEVQNKRKLVSVRTIQGVRPIDGADSIEVVQIGGWEVVVLKGLFKTGDQCVYFEIDSALPDGVPAWQFLVDKSSRLLEGSKVHKLRTIKLRGTLSQGFVLPIQNIPLIAYVLASSTEEQQIIALSKMPPREINIALSKMTLGEIDIAEAFINKAESKEMSKLDFSELLGVKKWEDTLPACLVGQAQGLFPSWIKKTDQERAQNLFAEIFGYEEQLRGPVDRSLIPVEDVETMIQKGSFKEVDGELFRILPPKADRNESYEISMKLDGSSMTVYGRNVDVEIDGVIVKEVQTGVCSRNLELKVNAVNSSNSFVKMAVESGLLDALSKMAADGIEIAVQGELIGDGIQGNQEMVRGQEYHVFDIFNIKDQKYLSPLDRRAMFRKLTDEYHVKIKHVPILHESITLPEFGAYSIPDLLCRADGPSLNAPRREGLVFKSTTKQFSFKTISNLWLLKSKE